MAYINSMTYKWGGDPNYTSSMGFHPPSKKIQGNDHDCHKGGSNKIPWELKVTFTDSIGIFQCLGRKNHLKVISWLVPFAIWLVHFPILEREFFPQVLCWKGGFPYKSWDESLPSCFGNGEKHHAGARSCRWGARVAMRG